MFCGQCGAEVKEGAKFCPMCGAKIENKNNLRKAMGKKKAIIGIVAVVLIVIGITGYSTAGLSMSKNNLASDIEQQHIEKFIEQKNVLEQKWETLDAFDVPQKKEVIQELKDLKQYGKIYRESKQTLRQLKKEMGRYELDETAYNKYIDFLTKWEEAYEEKNPYKIVECSKTKNKQLEKLKTSNEQYMSSRIRFYENIDLSKAEKNVKTVCENGLKKLKELKKTNRINKYSEFKKISDEMNSEVYMFIEPKKQVSVSVQQVDATEYPKVKLYLDVKDSNTQKTPTDLEDSFFYINREDSNEKFVKQTVKEVNQLNEEEPLKVNMVADVSGSMNGDPLQDAKTSMSGFINSLQFKAGDMVELTSFATGVRLEEEITNDKNRLLDDISDLVTGDMTSLYDALYTAAGRIASQSGARCVIAFTDGEDNYSNCSEQDVIDIANRYHVPIFIIGIGSKDYSGASRIAQETGGRYYNTEEIISMEDIYNEIYRMEKDLYLLEYEDATGQSASQISKIRIGYRSPEYGGECEYSYTPNILMNVDAKGFYTGGPEKVVEGYIKNFMSAMTHQDISYVEDYLLSGSDIYNDQSQYVKQGINEQLDSYEIVNTEYSDENNCIVTTRETIYVQVPNQPLELMTQQCKYRLIYIGTEWKMTAFADQVEVLNRINQ